MPCVEEYWAYDRATSEEAPTKARTAKITSHFFMRHPLSVRRHKCLERPVAGRRAVAGRVFDSQHVADGALDNRVRAKSAVARRRNRSRAGRDDADGDVPGAGCGYLKVGEILPRHAAVNGILIVHVKKLAAAAGGGRRYLHEAKKTLESLDGLAERHGSDSGLGNARSDGRNQFDGTRIRYGANLSLSPVVRDCSANRQRHY